MNESFYRFWISLSSKSCKTISLWRNLRLGGCYCCCLNIGIGEWGMWWILPERWLWSHLSGFDNLVYAIVHLLFQVHLVSPTERHAFQMKVQCLPSLHLTQDQLFTHLLMCGDGETEEVTWTVLDKWVFLVLSFWTTFFFLIDLSASKEPIRCLNYKIPNAIIITFIMPLSKRIQLNFFSKAIHHASIHWASQGRCSSLQQRNTRGMRN